MPSHQAGEYEMAVKPEFLANQPSPMAKKSEPNRSKTYDPKKVHITETPMTRYNWYKHVDWLNVYFILGVPLYGLVQSYWVPLQLKTAIFAFVYYFLAGLGITAGTFNGKCIILWDID